MTRRVTIRDVASSDLDAIYRYSVARWGRTQALRYLDEIDQLLQLLAEYPEIGRERTEISPPVRLHPSRSHLVIYRADSDALDLLRLVHARSDWVEILKN